MDGASKRWLRFIEQNLCVVKWNSCPGLGSAFCCHAEGQRAVVSLIGRTPVKRGVRTSGVVKFQITADRRAGLRDALVGLEIDLLVLQCPPEPLNKHVVSPRPLSVHADRDVTRDQNVRKRIACELAALIGVEIYGLP